MSSFKNTIFLFVVSLFLVAGSFAQTPVPMASQPGLSYTENFADIANWTNGFAGGIGANRFGAVAVNATGTIPDGVRITAATSTFQTAQTGGVQRGTSQTPSTQSIVLLSTGSTDNSSSAAIDFVMDFTGVNAGTLSFDWASLNNSTGNRAGSLRVYASADGVSFEEITGAQVLNFINNSPTSGSVTSVALPASFNNNANARLRFYYHNGSGGTTGSRPKISIDNLNVTAVLPPPVISFQFASYVEDEAQTLFVFAQRSGDLTGTSSVEFTTFQSNLTGAPLANGGATCADPGVDYVATSETLTFGPNDISAGTSIEICSDVLIEPTEVFPLILFSPTNATIGPTDTIFAEINDVASQFASFEPIGIGNNSNTFSGSIDVTTPQSTVFNLRVTLFDVEFSNSENLDVLLVGPEGQKMLLMADAGGTNGLSGRTTLTFSDNAGQVLPDDSLIGAGSYEPTTWEPGQTDFLAPAPIGPYAEPGSEVGGAVTLGSVFSGTNPNGTWTLYVRNDQNAFQPLGLAGDIGGWGIQLLAPTAAGVSVSGTVKSGKVGIKDARITVSGGNLDQPIVTRTNSFGNYTVEGLTAGETYIITVDSRRYTFTEPTRVLNVTDNVTELDFNSDVR